MPAKNVQYPLCSLLYAGTHGANKANARHPPSKISRDGEGEGEAEGGNGGKGAWGEGGPRAIALFEPNALVSYD